MSTKVIVIDTKVLEKIVEVLEPSLSALQSISNQLNRNDYDLYAADSALAELKKLIEEED